MKRLLICVLILGFVAMMPLSVGGREYCFNATVDGIKDNPTFLVVGVDNAAENTDFIMLSAYDAKENSFNFLQIPRDTYCGSSSSTGKINGVYAKERANGKNSYEAMEKLSDYISKSCGVRIDGFVCYNLAAVERLVDSVGGVDITLKSPIEITDSAGKVLLSLKSGVNHLSGRDATIFIRHRKGYATQDLGRLDAQKLFLSAFLDSFKSEMGLKLAAKFLLDRGEGMTTNLRVADFINLLVKNRGRISSMTAKLATMPGRAVLDSRGISYYSLSRSATVELLPELGFTTIGEFDSNRIFRNKANADFSEIYDSLDIKYVVYDSDTIRQLIPK